MFVGLIGEDLKPIHPHVVSRIACEIIDWDLASTSYNKIVFRNRRSVSFKVYMPVKNIIGAAYFLEADSFERQTSIAYLPKPIMHYVNPGETIVFNPHKLAIWTTVTAERTHEQSV
jgi:hypothetical protein